ncbi:hypothetical protein BGZ72_001688 [Mortierella alpina]|nr:hypothetical protein BGZ72_001688 [Mortierella alpina]
MCKIFPNHVEDICELMKEKFSKIELLSHPDLLEQILKVLQLLQNTSEKPDASHKKPDDSDLSELFDIIKNLKDDSPEGPCNDAGKGKINIPYDIPSSELKKRHEHLHQHTRVARKEDREKPSKAL